MTRNDPQTFVKPSRTPVPTHTPFGESLLHPDATDDQGDYTGHIRDRQTGLSYMQARYQDPLIGRFLSIDPMTFMSTGSPDYFNRYSYTANDPINRIDPDGEFWGVASKVVKVAIKGGDVASVLAGAKQDIGTLTSSNASGWQKLGAAASLATEVFSPVSARDAKAGAKFAQKNLGGKCCFVAGTLVETEYGLRPIEEIELGDRVLARNPETGETAFKAVTDLIRLNERQIWEVSLSGNEGASEFFETTNDHPWWIVDEADQGSWKDTAELSAGMIVTTADNQTMIITNVVETSRVDATYNLTVADFETYFVGENKVLVHNCKIQDATRRQSGTPNRDISTSRDSFEKEIEASGFERTDRGGGTSTFTNEGGDTYTTYTRSSTDAPGATYKPANQNKPTVKYNLEKDIEDQ